MRADMDALLNVKLQTLNGRHAELSAEGEIDASTQDQLRSLLFDVIARGATDLVLDLGAVTFLDSSGLRGIVEAIQRGATIKVRKPQPAVQIVFDIVEIPGLTVES
jgi:anti-sigma B factor antagonist